MCIFWAGEVFAGVGFGMRSGSRSYIRLHPPGAGSRAGIAETGADDVSRAKGRGRSSAVLCSPLGRPLARAIAPAAAVRRARCRRPRRYEPVSRSAADLPALRALEASSAALRLRYVPVSSGCWRTASRGRIASFR
jgi:hypothetical protein